MIQEIAIAISLSILVALVFHKYLRGTISSRLFYLAFSGHLILGAIVYLYFAHVAGRSLDMMNFLADANASTKFLKEYPQLKWLFFSWIDVSSVPLELYPLWDQTYFLKNSGALHVIKLHVIIDLLTNSNIWIHILLFHSISFAALLLIIKSFKSNESSTLLIMSFVPGILFWTSSMLKEGLVLFGIALILYGLKTKVIKAIILFLIGGSLLLLMRSYLAALLLFSIVIVLLSSKFNYRFNLIQLLLFSLLVLFASDLLIDQGFYSQLINKFSAFDTLEKGGSSFSFLEMNSLLNIIITSLLAIDITLLKPFSFNSIMLAYLSFENMVCIILCAWAIWSTRKQHLSQQEKIVYLFTLLCYFVIGFIVRNDGAIHRYKSAITLVAMLHIANRFYFSKKEPVEL